ncbi:endo-beta-N-acetylglucosaminidase D [Catenulispora sp. MAP5-51]|uniref:endo-beta-N-acetylglucosaminidase n=1 Tax=Catenulispora sp. MAP5-51 TaxID=3156298 RepID=UPI0035194AF7
MSHETIEATHALPPPPGSIKDKDGLVTWPHEPWLHGYLAKDLANWSQATDPYAKYLRSRVPLAQRIPVFSATQANPRLTYGPQVSELSRDYVLNMTCRGLRYQDDATLRTSRFWQYVDMFGAWHGVITAGASPPDCSVYGVVNLPNPAWTDAAHRNGVKSLGCWYWPRTDDFAQLVAKKADGSFPVADRLLAMAAYFGFDGYFINQEAKLKPEDKREALAKALMEMFAYMRAKAPAGFHLQWYDAMLPNGDLGYQNEFNAANSPWIRNGGTRVCDSIFVNYWWDSAKCETSRTRAKTLGLAPYEVVSIGTNVGDNGFVQSDYDPRVNFPEGGTALNGWGLFDTSVILCPPSGADLHDPTVQTQRYEMERYFWSGPKGDPTRTGRLRPPSGGTGDPYSDYEVWDGVAHYITERSVIGGFPFVTRFNTGKGFGTWVGGQQLGTAQWANAGVADILPTWQWWVTANGGSPPLTVDYDSTMAWNGGASLRVTGRQNVGDQSTVHLYKTRLRASSTTTARIRYNAGRAGSNLGLFIDLLFEDSPTKPTSVPVGKSYSAGWNTETVSLGTFAGRTIAAINLRFATPVPIPSYGVNIGELAFLDGPITPPPTPKSFTIDAAYTYGTVAEALLSWTLDPSVWYYDIVRIRPDGSTETLARTFDEACYIQLERISAESATRILLAPVSRNGDAGQAASVVMSWSNGETA